MVNLVEQYIEDLKVCKLSVNTRSAYLRDIKKFAEFIYKSDIRVENTNKLTILSYCQYLQNEGLSNSSIVRHIVSVRRFYKSLLKKGIISMDPLINYDTPNLKRSIPQVLTIEEINKLLSCPDLSTAKGVRDKAMLELMYATGLKVTELLNLTIFDVNLKLSYIRCIGTKEKERIVPLGSYAINCIKQYIEVRHTFNPNNDILFVNSKGTTMTRQGFHKIVKYYAKLSDLRKDINSYTLRHSFAVHLIENGADLKSVQEMLGHSAVTATQIYSDISKKRKLVEVYKNSHPRA